MLGQWLIDRLFFDLRSTMYDPRIIFFYGAVFKCKRQMLVCILVFCKYNYATRPFIKPVNGKYFTITLLQKFFEVDFFSFPVRDAEQSCRFIQADKIIGFEKYFGEMQ